MYYYNFISLFLFIILAVIWSKSSFLDIFLKILFSLMSLWATIEVLMKLNIVIRF